MDSAIMAIFKKTFLFAIIFIPLSLGNGENTIVPQDTEAAVGSTVSLFCKTSTVKIEWHHFPVGNSIDEIVYQDGFIFNGYKGRFSVNQSAHGEYNLVINNVQTADAGKYTCMEKSKVVVQNTAELFVFEKYPSEKFCAAKFTCAPVCDSLELTCPMKVHGNTIPAMEWRESANGILTSNSNIENGITISSIHLEPKRVTAQSYSCQVKYPKNSSMTSQFSWSYLISVPAPLAQTSSEEKVQDQSNDHRFIITIAVLSTASVVIVVFNLIQFFNNKRSKHEFVTSKVFRNTELYSYKDTENGSPSENTHLLNAHLLEPEDVDVNPRGFVPRTPPNKNKSITGIGVLGNELFLVTRDGGVIEVFDLDSRKFKRAWTVEGLINPNDMATCSMKGLVFLCDWKKAGESRELFCCDRNGILNCRWTSETERGQISVTKESNVIIAENYFNTIREYTYFGRLVQKFDAAKGKLHLWHAIKLENGNFVASFGDEHDENQMICVFDSQGATLHTVSQDSFQQFGVKFSVPRSFVVDKKGNIYVCDLYNGRIILLTPELQYIGKIDEGENKERLCGPLRICFHESDKKGQLVVADSVKKNGKWIDGRILVFNPTRYIKKNQSSSALYL